MNSRIASLTVLLLSTGIALAEPDPAKVKRAIRGGQDFLRAIYKPGGGGPAPGMAVPGGGLRPIAPAAAALQMVGGTGAGPAALAGLALLESGAGKNDESVVYITRGCRDAALHTQSTYEVALIIMLLDRLGSPADEVLIQLLTLRLLTGQTQDGSWSYTCDGLNLDAVEAQLIKAEHARESRLTTPEKSGGGKDKPKPREDLIEGSKPPQKEPPPEPKEAPKEKKGGLNPALAKIINLPRPGGGPNPGRNGGSGDHSNTQFATMGLWCGRRHSVDVNDALTKLDNHYRQCQQADNGWGYTAASGNNSSPAMTCAGLMGLAIGFGAKNLKEGADRQPKLENPEALGKDPKVMSGLKYVGDFIAAAGGDANELSRNLYFMWSLERVGMVYGLNTIGRVDWYDWGASILLRTQNRDGSWISNSHSATMDNATSFALLFLSRANLAEDLSDKLKGKVNDPGTARLVAGGDLDKLLQGTGKGSSGPKKSEVAAKDPPPPKVAPLPPAEFDAGGRLANTLIAAGASDRDDLIAKYRDTKGGEYTDALARAASKLTGDNQTRVRDALAQRLTRMTSNTLNELMRDRDRELRRAAALATAAKGKDRFAEFADNLILLIADDDAAVVQAARVSLKALTDQDFGPEAASANGDRGKAAAAAWRAWWEGRKK